MPDAPVTLDRWGFPVRMIRLVREPAPARAPLKTPATPKLQQGIGSYAPRLDSGLRELCATQQPGQTFSHAEIAEKCDVSKDTIALLERQALRKIRHRLPPALFTQFREALYHHDLHDRTAPAVPDFDRDE